MADGFITARDGRTIAYREFGDSGGTPIVMCHGSAESRLFEVDPEWTAAQGVRVIVPDRPGFGASDPLPDRTLVGWSADAEDLLDALGLRECALIGWSGGGPHALAAARALGPRATALSLVGSFAPFHLVPGAYEAMAPQLRLLADIAPADPRGTAALVAEVAKEWVDDPDTFSLGGESPPEDAAIENDPVWGENLRRQVREGLRRADGIAWDAAVLYGDWGFGPQEVTQPTAVWHGTADAVTPCFNGRWLAETLPNAELHEVPGGHFIVYPRWREIVAGLQGSAS